MTYSIKEDIGKYHVYMDTQYSLEWIATFKTYTWARMFITAIENNKDSN